MKYGIKTLDDFDYQGKTVLCRIDINEPVDRKTDTLKDITRIEACIVTLKELSDKGARLVLMAHQGSDIEYKNFYSTKPHQKYLSELLGKEVKFADDVCGPTAQEMIRTLKDGEILLLDNVRFCSEEQTLFERKLDLSFEQMTETQVVKRLAPLADLYVCDAFAAAHRKQPTLCGFEQVLPSAMGRLFEKEYATLAKLVSEPEHICTFVLGGAKIDDAFDVMETVLASGSADLILTGGVVANVMLWAKGIEIGKGSKEYISSHNFEGLIPRTGELMEKYGSKIVLPMDVAYLQDGKRQEAAIDSIPEDAGILDIGFRTVEEYKQAINESKTIFLNGPMGVFEDSETEKGTKEVLLASAGSDGFTCIGGGDSIASLNKYGIKDKMNYVCTGGGAMIQFLSGKELPVVEALKKGAAIE